MISRIGFVAGPEIKDFAIAALPGATGTKNFAALKPAEKNNLVRVRDGERFAIHFLVGNFEIAVDALCDGMARIANPDAFFLAGFAPGQRTGGAEQPLEDFRVMSRMKDDEAHTLKHARLDAINDLVVDVSVGGVSPPGQDVGLVENLLGKAVFGLGEGRCPHLDAGGFPQALGDGFMHAVGVDISHGGILFFMHVLAPHGHSDFSIHN